MRKLVIGITTLGLALAQVAPAFAQGRGRPDRPEEVLQKREEAAVDKQYKATLQREKKNATQQRNDPWADMRTPNNGQKK